MRQGRQKWIRKNCTPYTNDNVTLVFDSESLPHLHRVCLTKSSYIWNNFLKKSFQTAIVLHFEKGNNLYNILPMQSGPGICKKCNESAGHYRVSTYTVWRWIIYTYSSLPVTVMSVQGNEQPKRWVITFFFVHVFELFTSHPNLLSPHLGLPYILTF